MGSGFKTFTAGSVLTASDVNNYLMEQTTMVFATTAARDSAVVSPEEGMVAYITGEDRVYIYSGTAWVRTQLASTTSGRTGFLVKRTANQAIGNTFTDISFDGEDVDTDGFFTATSTTVTIPSGLGGLYMLTFNVGAGFPTNGSGAGIRIVAGGVTYQYGWASVSATGTISAIASLAATNTITCGVFQMVGGNANFTATLTGYRISV